ncbi:MAG: sulfatase-like hydrolase/transferase [Chloroflexi bacterium]|nr:sulfatase-like hydrolase/transferase [Chloroflexota bacterium]
MKNNRWVIIGIVFFVIVAVGNYFWVNAQMDSLFAYRSLLHNSPPVPGEAFEWAQEEKPTRRVVFILVDALRNDTSHKKDVMPYLNELRAQAAWATSHSQAPSYSAPGYSVIGTGAWPYLSDGPAMNLDYEEIPTWTQDNIFSAAHRAGLKTAISGYYWFEKLVPQNDVDASFYTPEEDTAADRAVLDAAAPWLKSDDYQFILIHLDQVDYAGHHEGGPQDPRWDEAAKRVDDHIREIVSLLDLELDTVVITSDHGQIDKGGHGGHEEIVLREPLVLAGAGIIPGQYPDTEMVDLAPTLATLLGANIPATSQGHILFDMLALSETQKVVVEKALIAQQRQLHAAYTESFSDPLPIREDMDFVTGTTFAIEATSTQQEDKERRLSFNLPVFLTIIPAYLIFRNWKKVKMLFAGALAYILLFNVYYVLVAQRTYSFSSVAGLDSFVLFNAITAVVLLGAIWLFLILKLGILKKGVAESAEKTILLTAFILYLLSLPVLWHYAVNGSLVTWFLPEFPIMFRGFLGMVQSIMVAVVGIVLTGVGALAAKFTKKS